MKSKTVTPKSAEHTRLKDFLKRAGLNDATVAYAIGSAPAGRSRSQIASNLAAWLKSQPRRQPAAQEQQPRR
jgi:hypothetical protein